MTDLNSINLIGRLTKDMELSYTNTGLPIGKLSLAVNTSVKKSENEWEDYPNFFDCKLVGKRAESLAQYLLKGVQVGLLGSLKQERWEKDGQKRSAIRIEVENIQLLSKPNQANSSPNNSFKPSKGQNQGYSSSNTQANFEDDIPF